MRIHLSALGCRLNEAELEHWATQFMTHGHQIAKRVETADVLVVNTCAVTREAMRKSRQRISRLKRGNPLAKLVVSGCYSQLESDSALADLGIDLVVNNQNKDQLVADTLQAFNLAGMPQGATLPGESALFERSRHRAFIKIQDGCRYKCTFCIVTVARGSERSREIQSIVDQVCALSDQGIHEIVLTGVHVGGYGTDLGSNLEMLVRALLQHTDMPRIRFASVEPWDLSDGFLELFSNPRLLPHMHLPLQSGSDSVLKRMARRCKTADYARLTQELYDRVPQFNVTTDIIVGFPGESEEEWQQSLAFIRTQKFGHIHVFTYSERSGTHAAKLPDQIPMPVRRERSRKLHEVADSLKQQKLEKSVGQEVSVLWEQGKPVGDSSSSTVLHEYQGYTPNYQRVVVQSEAVLSNRVLTTRLIGLTGKQLDGKVLSNNCQNQSIQNQSIIEC
ncbi:MAG: tRNA (N(6)-L-threonylcarbamoyladenosine(37)-C(2))-methylthiotransferase MtaB [Granulosicoccus sp.]|nr:tRNA (N(6)-L-threonylcarbamoyladenosine(37)-C(2))-methylthiotransferase MtaB [Granulosicoccus sp.]